MSEAVREKMKKNLTEKLLAMLYGSSGRGGERRRMGAPTDARLCHHLAADNHLQIQTDSLPEMTEERNRRNTHTHTWSGSGFGEWTEKGRLGSFVPVELSAYV